MNQTQQITIADTNGQSTTYVPKPEVEIPAKWLLALEFVKKVQADLPNVNGSGDFPALVSLLIHLT